MAADRLPIDRRPTSRSSRSAQPCRGRHRRLTDHLPEHARDIYREAFNSAWDEYKDPDGRRGDASREETAHKVASGRR